MIDYRLWDDGESKWKKNVQDIDGEVLCGTLPSHHHHDRHGLF